MAKNQKDYYYYKAKEDGYRSRASYKLKQIQEREHIIKKKDNIVDIGAAPGGWLQVSRELSSGKILGVDIQYIQPLKNVFTIKGDIRNKNTIEIILKTCDFNVDVVLCDIAPNLTGNWILDHNKGIELNEKALYCTKKILKKGGVFVIKVFQGEYFLDFFKKLKTIFKYVRSYSPLASRSTSSEMYIICKKYLKNDLIVGNIYLLYINEINKNGDGVSYLKNGYKIFIKNTILINKEVFIQIKKIDLNYGIGIIVSNKNI